ncbi:MAG: CDP-alcohol phosphatidyltransferase family protein [Candidatus Aminicenantes bacterium]|nr:CDP-alcohol phosphatidyltransferase family protein [Candidatus Aminicenantes bacterium]
MKAQTPPVAASSEKARLLNALPRKLIAGFHAALDRVADFLVSIKASPNCITVLGLVAGIAAGLLFALGLPLAAAGLIALCGIFDILDGKVALRTQKRSLYGAIFDSTLDRYSEFFIYLGLAYYFRNRWPLWILFFTFLGSSMVSYTRARAEGLGFECKVGFMQRAERMILLLFGSFLGPLFGIFDPVITVILIIIALVSNVTAFQRILLVRREEKRRRLPPQGEKRGKMD